MKKILNFSLLLIASLALMLTGCKKEEIVFDHEKPQFELKADAILMEVIVPSGTAAKEDIYIVGPFNGLDTVNYENPIFKLTKAEKNNSKFGIYLYPDEFVDGKTLADGFWFVSAKQGLEKGAPMHTIAGAQLGVRYDESIVAWAGAKEDPEIEHDGYVIYFLDETGWDAITLYAWGSIEAFGAWPGTKPMGKEKINGTEYLYIDCGAANEGADLNLIFSNNGSDQLDDFKFTVDKNIFLKVSLSGVEEMGAPGDKFPYVEHDGQDIIYVADGANWGAMALYMWGDVNNLDRDGGESAGWPGLQADGTFEFKGMKWYYFLMGEANNGKNENVILNNNDGGSQTSDINTTLADGNQYIYLVNADKSVTKIDDPDTYDFEGGEPQPEPDKTTLTIFLYNGTEALNQLKDTIGDSLVTVDTYMYCWGTPNNILGEWPGTALKEYETMTILGLELIKMEIECEVGNSFNFILNNKGTHPENVEEGKQYDAFGVTVTEPDMELYYKLTDTVATPLQVAPLAPRRK